MFGKAIAVAGVAANIVSGAVGIVCDHVGPALGASKAAACKVIELGGAVAKPVAKVAETTFEVTKSLVVKRPW